MAVDDAQNGPLLGSWARWESVTGLVADVDGDEVALFDPAARQVVRAPRDRVQRLPAAALTVTAVVDLPLPHGLDEADVRRWVATLLDGVLRERAGAALRDAGLDDGPARPSVRVDVRPASGSGSDALCVAGHRTPAPAGASTACPRCGRLAVAPPPPSPGPAPSPLGV